MTDLLNIIVDNLGIPQEGHFDLS